MSTISKVQESVTSLPTSAAAPVVVPPIPVPPPVVVAAEKAAEKAAPILTEGTPAGTADAAAAATDGFIARLQKGIDDTQKGICKFSKENWKAFNDNENVKATSAFFWAWAPYVFASGGAVLAMKSFSNLCHTNNPKLKEVRNLAIGAGLVAWSYNYAPVSEAGSEKKDVAITALVSALVYKVWSNDLSAKCSSFLSSVKAKVLPPRAVAAKIDRPAAPVTSEAKQK